MDRATALVRLVEVLGEPRWSEAPWRVEVGEHVSSPERRAAARAALAAHTGRSAARLRRLTEYRKFIVRDGDGEIIGHGDTWQETIEAVEDALVAHV